MVLLLFAAPAVAQAQQPGKDLVPFKATSTSTADAFVIPTEPPIVIQRITGSGEASPLGAYTIAQHAVLQLNADGSPLSFAGSYANSAANGDALFGTYSGLFRPSGTPGVVAFDGAFLITGGRGRFAGATGGGVARGEVDPATGKATLTLDGVVSRPKP
jgi:hypothetical protein